MTTERIVLPGIGVCHISTTRAEQRIGVICHVSGRRDIVLYDGDDPDRAACTLPLTPDEAHWVSDLLDATVTIDHLSELEQELTGVSAARIRLPVGSPYEDRPLHATRTPSGAAIVAVVRNAEVIAGPDPDFVLRRDDTVIAVGDRHSIAGLAAMLNDTAQDSVAG